MAGFDVQAARQAGYSDDEILQHLTQTRNFDVDGAVKAGYSKQDVIDHLSGTSAPAPSAPTLTNQFPATNIGPAESGPAAYMKRLEGNVRYGGDSTVGGWLLKKLGAQGTDVGAQGGTQEQTLASPVLGSLRSLRGTAETIQGNPFQGTKDTVAGGLQAASLPLQFMGGPELEGASQVPGKVAGAVPSAERAGKAFQEVMSAAKSKPVQVTPELSQALDRYSQLVNAGGSRSLAIHKLLNRVTNPEMGPMTYQEARDFASNISRLSADEFQRLTPAMRQQVGAVRVALNNTIQQTATAAGKGAEYSGAMKEYAAGSRKNQALEDFGNYVYGQAKDKVPWLVFGMGAKKAYDVFGK